MIIATNPNSIEDGYVTFAIPLWECSRMIPRYLSLQSGTYADDCVYLSGSYRIVDSRYRRIRRLWRRIRRALFPPTPVGARPPVALVLVVGSNSWVV